MFIGSFGISKEALSLRVSLFILRCEIIFGGAWVADTISSLVINTIVSYMEVGLETPLPHSPPDQQKVRVNASEKSSIQVRPVPIKKTETRQRWKTQEHHPTME